MLKPSCLVSPKDKLELSSVKAWDFVDWLLRESDDVTTIYPNEKKRERGESGKKHEVFFCLHFPS